MESIYVPRYKKTIEVASFLDSFKSNLGNAGNIPRDNTEIKSKMNFKGTDSDFASLEDSISLRQISHFDDMKPVPFDPHDTANHRHSATKIPKKALHLETITALVASHGKFNESYRRRYVIYDKYNHVKIVRRQDERDHQNLNVNDEIVLAIRFYQPFIYRPNAKYELKPKLSQSFLVLGSQFLTELRDKLYCESRHAPLCDISDDPSTVEPKNKPFDHGFFFIGDTFYNDTRQPTIDYSAVIREWASRRDDIAELKTDAMEDTKFRDLTVRLGYPYLYQHYGNCEHLFTISDIRLLSATDPLIREQYPLLKIFSNNKNLFCLICGLKEACIVVKDSPAHINDPSHLCYDCFKLYHYVDGKKNGNFKAYRYHGNSILEWLNK